MQSNPRFTMRYLLAAIVVVAVVFAGLRPIYDRYRENLRHQALIQRHRALVQRGTSIILAFGRLGPVNIPAAKWQDAVRHINDTWRYSNHDLELPEAEIEDIENQMQAVLDQAQSGAEEGDLLSLLDLIGHRRAGKDLPGNRATDLYIASDVVSRYFVDRSLFDASTTNSERSLARIVRYALRSVEKPSHDPVGELSACLADPDWRVRAMACHGLRAMLKFGRDGGAIAVLVRALKDRDPLIRELAAEGLQTRGPDGAKVESALVETAIHDTSIMVRQLALKRIALNGHRSGDLGTRVLLVSLRDPDQNIRTAAINSFQIRGNSQATLTAVVEVLATDRDEAIRASAALALGLFDDTGQTVPVLTRALGDKSFIVQEGAAESLGRIGDTARSALPALVALYNDRIAHHVPHESLEQAVKLIQGRYPSSHH